PVLRTSSCNVGGWERPLQADTGWWWSLIHFGTVLQCGQPRTAAASLLADFTITPKGVLLQRGRPGAATAGQMEIAGSIGHTVQSMKAGRSGQVSRASLQCSTTPAGDA